MKKSHKFFVTVALVLLLAILPAVIIPVLNNSYLNDLESSKVLADESFEKLQSSLNKLTSQMNKFTGNVDDYVGTQLENEAWADASEMVLEAIETVEKTEDEFFASFVNEKKTLTYVNYFDYYSNGKYTLATFSELKSDVCLRISRATSANEINKLIEDYKKDIYAVSTNLEVLYSTLEALEKDGVAYSELSLINTAIDFLSGRYRIHDDIYDLTTDEDGKNEKMLLQERLADAIEDFKEVAINEFIATVAKLPETQLITLSKDEATVDTAHKIYDDLLIFATTSELVSLNNKDLNDAETTLNLADKHISVLKDMLGSAEDVGSAEYINAQIKAYETTVIKADLATKQWLDQLLALVETWENKVWVCDEYEFTVVTYEKDKNFVSENYNMINRKSLEQYVNKFQKEADVLDAALETFVDAVDYIVPVGLYSEEDIATARKCLAQVEKLCPLNEVDAVLGYDGEYGLIPAYLALVDYEERFEALVEAAEQEKEQEQEQEQEQGE